MTLKNYKFKITQNKSFWVAIFNVIFLSSLSHLHFEHVIIAWWVRIFLRLIILVLGTKESQLWYNPGKKGNSLYACDKKMLNFLDQNLRKTTYFLSSPSIEMWGWQNLLLRNLFLYICGVGATITLSISSTTPSIWDVNYGPFSIKGFLIGCLFVLFYPFVSPLFGSFNVISNFKQFSLV